MVSNPKYKRPTILYGEVLEVDRSQSGIVVLQFKLLSKNQTAYLDLPPKNEDQMITVYLKDDWTSTVILENQRANIILPSPLEGTTVEISDSNNTYFIITPDHLLTVTNIAISYTCLRRAVLSSYISCYEESKYSIFGRLRHSLMEVMFINRSYS